MYYIRFSITPSPLRCGHHIWTLPKAAANTGNTPLMMAAIRGNVEVAKLLLRCPRTDIEVKSREEKTALDYAKKSKHTEIAKAIESRETLLREGHTC